MKTYTLLNYDYIFCDHFAKVSNEAKLLYIEMMFFANQGFVSNVKSILDSRCYEIGVLNELIANEDVLTLPDREEVFITSFYVHNKGVNKSMWTKTPYYYYWKGKLWIKENGVATFKEKMNTPKTEQDLLPLDRNVEVVPEQNEEEDIDWVTLLESIDHPK